MRVRDWMVGIVAVAASLPVLVTASDRHRRRAGGAGSLQRTCRSEPATLVGSGELDGTPGRDVIVATAPNTLVHAGAGDDLVCGSRRVHGQQGDDEIHYSGAREAQRQVLHPRWHRERRDRVPQDAVPREQRHR